jgi:hypothetical protein
MAKNTNNQVHSRKKQGNRQDQPSKAPGQDQDAREFISSPQPERNRADDRSGQQGISNRPAGEEHALPDSDEPQVDNAAGNVDTASPNSRAGIAAAPRWHRPSRFTRQVVDARQIDHLPARVLRMSVPTAIRASRGTGWMVASICTS